MAEHYFAAEPDAFWRWSTGSEAVTTRGGTTIAFYQEVLAVLRALEPNGFPAFDAIVLFLAACRNNWPADEGMMRDVGSCLAACPDPIDRSRLQASLTHFHDIAGEHRITVEGKAALAVLVFNQGKPLISADQASQIVAHLDSRGMDKPRTRKPSASRTARALADLVDGVSSLNAEQIEMRLRTGLDSMISQASIPELPLAIGARQLINDLRDDEGELRGIACLALDLMAAVHIPRAVDEPEELPLGGYSDISNQGEPDRLLLTELAQDDDVLAARVSLNEALYLRREAPPRTPQRQRDIIIDTGIRLWGVPRVFATALGLALCATADHRQPLRVFRSDEDNTGIDSVDLFTREGLTEQLAALATQPHPGRTLRSAVEQYDYSGGCDLVVITHPDAFADPEFQQILRDLALPKLYVALVDSEGAYELKLVSPRGEKRLQRAKCSLDEILNPGAHAVASLLNPDVDSDLPIALRMRAFPLLAAHPLNSEHAAFHSDVGLAVYLRDGRVVLWEKPGFGGRMLYCPIRQTQVAWLGIDEPRREILLVHASGGDQPPVLTRIPLNGGAAVGVTLDVPAPPDHVAFALHPAGQLICVENGLKIRLLSTRTGKCIASLGLPCTGRLHGRYIQDVSNQWQVIGYQNNRLTSEPVPVTALPNRNIVRCFDRTGYEGTHVVLANGSVFRLRPEPSLVHKMPSGITGVRAISRDGSRILYVDHQNSLQLLDLDLGRFDVIPPRVRHPLQLVEKDVVLFHKRTPTLRKNFRAVAVTPDCQLCLITRNSQIMMLCHSPTRGMLHLQNLASRPMFSSEASFNRIDSPFGEHHLLDRARFPDGTRVYLESRGFLHIVPGDPTLPQAVLVLKDGMLSGWFSDNAWFGDRYFVGDHTPIDSASANDRLMHCIRNLEPTI